MVNRDTGLLKAKGSEEFKVVLLPLMMHQNPWKDCQVPSRDSDLHADAVGPGTALWGPHTVDKNLDSRPVFLLL